MTPKEKALDQISSIKGIMTLGAPMIKKESVIELLNIIKEDVEKIREAPIQNTLHEKDDCDWSRL